MYAIGEVWVVGVGGGVHCGVCVGGLKKVMERGWVCSLSQDCEQ